MNESISTSQRVVSSGLSYLDKTITCRYRLPDGREFSIADIFRAWTRPNEKLPHYQERIDCLITAEGFSTQELEELSALMIRGCHPPIPDFLEGAERID